MQEALYQYLILHGEVSLPGIGTICLQKKSSLFDFTNKVVNPPSYSFIMKSAAESPSRKTFDSLSKALKVTEWDAIRVINDFSFDLKNKISVSGQATWQNVGTLQRDDKGNIVLNSINVIAESEQPVPAEKVLRVKAEHLIRVGEMERTSFEMEELLSEPADKKDYGWLIGIVITVIAVMFVGWYLSENGVRPASAGNHSAVRIK